MNNLKPLIWEQGESIVNSFPDPILVSINELVEFAILIYNGDPDISDCFKLEIIFGHGHWDCFHYATIEQCQERANAWWKEKIQKTIVFNIPLGDGFFAIVDQEDYEKLVNFRWYRNANGYAYRSENGEHIAMHRQLMSPSTNMYIDHVNLDKLDNRKENLRICTFNQNQHNRTLQKNNTSGFKGVTWSKRDKKWIARIKVSGKKIDLGRFTCKVEAAKAYNTAAIEYHKEFANLNQIPE